MLSNFYAIDFKDGKLGILDTNDKVVEYYSPEQIKSIIKGGIVINGVVLNEETNPMYTIDGLKVNLAYKNHKKFGKWIVVLLKKGDKFGNTLSSCIDKETVLFYDSSVDWSKQEYPYGQYVTSYYLETLLGHNGRLCLDTSVSAWYVSAEDMNCIKNWLKQFNIGDEISFV